MEKTKARRVNRNDPVDFKVAVLAEFGLRGQTISEQSGLTVHQVRYRVGKFGQKLSDYRKGQGLAAPLILRHGQKWIGSALERELRQRLGKEPV